MEQGIGLEDSFDLTQILTGTINTGRCEEDTNLWVFEIVLDRFGHRNDVGFEMATGPQIESTSIGHHRFVEFPT